MSFGLGLPVGACKEFEGKWYARAADMYVYICICIHIWEDPQIWGLNVEFR